MTDSLLFIRDEAGLETKGYHYGNEHLFCNRALTGKWGTLSEPELDTYDVRLLRAIRERNTLLIQRYPKQADRKKLLDDFVSSYRAKTPRMQLVSGVEAQNKGGVNHG